MSSNDRNKVSENAINSDVVKSMIATWEEEEYNRLLVGINSCDEYNCDISDEYGTSKLHIEDFNYGVEKTRLDITDKLMHSIDFSENFNSSFKNRATSFFELSFVIFKLVFFVLFIFIFLI